MNIRLSVNNIRWLIFWSGYSDKSGYIQRIIDRFQTLQWWMNKWRHLKIIWNMIISGHLIVIICSSLTHSTPIIIYKNRFSFSRNKKYSLFFSHNFQNFLLLFSFFYKIFWTFSFLRLLPFHFSLFPLFPLPRLQLSVFF